MTRISELPEPYKTMAENNRKEYGVRPDSDSVFSAFNWVTSPEGFQFWSKVCNAVSKQDLPMIQEVAA